MLFKLIIMLLLMLLKLIQMFISHRSQIIKELIINLLLFFFLLALRLIMPIVLILVCFIESFFLFTVFGFQFRKNLEVVLLELVDLAFGCPQEILLDLAVIAYGVF